MKKRMILMLIIVGTLFVIIFGVKVIVGYLRMKAMMANFNANVSVSAMNVEYSSWQPKITATGTVTAVNGVEVTTEVAGLVRSIPHSAGGQVKKDTILLELNADSDIARLRALEASAALAKITYNRDKAQLAIQAVSQAVVDIDEADLKAKEAQVLEQAALIAKKTIRAPFSGRLGILYAQLGQFLNAGDKIITLQALDPIYVDFYVPQKFLGHIALGQSINVTTDTYPRQTFTGHITTIDPKIDVETRNAAVEATLPNPTGQLLPGMFAAVVIYSGKPASFLTVPQSAISYNAYGDIAYVLEKQGQDKNNQQVYIAKQVFVTLGETRGDQVAVITGLKEKELVVTSGQLKLKNGTPVIINNKVVPGNEAAPLAANE